MAATVSRPMRSASHSRNFHGVSAAEFHAVVDVGRVGEAGLGRADRRQEVSRRSVKVMRSVAVRASSIVNLLFRAAFSSEVTIRSRAPSAAVASASQTTVSRSTRAQTSVRYVGTHGT